jgi:hypothetical protein
MSGLGGTGGGGGGGGLGLHGGGGGGGGDGTLVDHAKLQSVLAPGRGLHSLPSQLKLSALHGIGAVRRGCVARVTGVLGGV